MRAASSDAAILDNSSAFDVSQLVCGLFGRSSFGSLFWFLINSMRRHKPQSDSYQILHRPSPGVFLIEEWKDVTFSDNVNLTDHFLLITGRCYR
jgi:hypothetical protein